MEGADWEPIVHRVLAGNVLPEELPEIPQRVVRVFLSSTGVDSQTERNALVERVYPPLREYCRQKYGVDFQMVDLEWGVLPKDNVADPYLTDFRFRELHNCQQMSAGPSFVAFIGQKYGERPLPSVIPAEEFETLMVTLRGHRNRDTRSATLLDDWYQKDDNSVPPAYLLTRLTERLPDYFSRENECREATQQKWMEEKEEMRRLLQKAAELAYLQGLIDGETQQKYTASTQDICIQHLTEESGESQNRCVMFARTIVDLKNYVEDKKATDFAEISLNEKTDLLELDETCATKLSQLKTRVKGLLSNRNCLDYDVLWRYDDVIHPKLHAPYLNKLCTEFRETLTMMIDQTVPKTRFDVEPDIYEEVLQHWLCCKRKAVNFYGQEEIVSGVKRYLAAQSKKPLIVYGESGSGKSTLLAKTATEVVKNSSGRTICAIRFIGYTPKSSDIKQVLMTLCHQLLHTLGRPSNDPLMIDLQRYFADLLNSFPKELNVVIFLDAIEQLIPEYNAHYLSWLPTELSPNIKIIIATHPTKHGILDRLQSEIIKDVNYTLRVTQMSQMDADGLMQYALSLYGRKVTTLQHSVFKAKFGDCSLAMFVQLLTHMAKHISSFDKLVVDDVPSNISEAINKFYNELEKMHGKVLVGRSLSYLVASVTGLSDCEMEDLLSLDEDVLNSVFISYHPPVRRIPYVKWLMLKKDIDVFLTSREADGVTVSLLCHEQFENVIKERYLSDEKVKKDVHSMLADYFLGTWSGRKKPVQVPECNGVQLLLPCGKEADRLVASQPLSFETPGNGVRFNKRKYDQVPRHLYLAGRLEELNSLVLFNYEWLYNKIKALSLTHIMADFVLNPGEEATLVEEALRVAESTIQSDINNLGPEISGHLLPYFKTHPNIRALVQQCDRAGLKHCALVPNFPYLQVPGSALQHTLASDVCSDFYILSGEDRFLLQKVKDSSLVHKFDVATGEDKGSIFASNGDLYVTPNGKLFVIVDHITEKAIKVHNSVTGEFVGQLIVMNHIELKVKEKYKMCCVSLTNERLSVIVTTDVSYLCIADLAGCEFLQIIALDGKCEVSRIAPNGRHIFCNSNEFMLCYDMYSLEHICTVPTGHRPSTLAFTSDGFRGYLANPYEAKLLVMHIHKGTVEMAYKSPLEEDFPDDQIVDLKVSPKDDMLLIRGNDTILVYDRFAEKVTVKFTRPDDVPKEFKLPKSFYTDLYFTNADFSRDGKFVFATMFRNLYLWKVSTGQRITTIQAPVGIITEMLISQNTSQVITHLKGSKDVQVWNVDDAVKQINMLDKLTNEVIEAKLTVDNSVAFVRCKDSDELGVIDMRNGILLDLLTHDAPIQDFACTPDGQYVLISSIPKKRNVAVKIWDMDERKVVKEFGNTKGYCLGAKNTQSIIYVAQEELNFKAPFYITRFSFMSEGFRESTHPLSLKYILDKPFLTSDDQNVVVLTAQDYLEVEADFDTPTICVFSLEDDYKVSYYTPESFSEVVNINTIKKVTPCSNQDSNCVMVMYSTNAVSIEYNEKPADQWQTQLGLLVLNIFTGAIITICEPFMNPGTPTDSIVFSDTSVCIDSDYNIFHIGEGRFINSLQSPRVPPTAVVLQGGAVIYYKDSHVFVVSLRTDLPIARCDVHSSISSITVCSDERTLLVGCHDGTVVSYVIIDHAVDDVDQIIRTMGSRCIDDVSRNGLLSGRTSRTWDRVEDQKCPTYSRPPSALLTGPKERVLLKQVEPAPKYRPSSETLIYLNERSRSCNVQ
ncbi:LOW QUALITY PROTEIN: NWD2-like protein [Mya arenaria]|uniref:NWD2-like protein n=1 Tax=Mya arenaria TaxID=6604 RepID=A0ABY7FTZ1_MYAAR|nr:LOW QUALITY PROTEIN: NWD2-like protein [Mya arenaria]